LKLYAKKNTSRGARKETYKSQYSQRLMVQEQDEYLVCLCDTGSELVAVSVTPKDRVSAVCLPGTKTGDKLLSEWKDKPANSIRILDPMGKLGPGKLRHVWIRVNPEKTLDNYFNGTSWQEIEIEGF
jgi:hypothetical protein